MLLFVSGRCDIPAFYSEWLFQRFKAGFVTYEILLILTRLVV